MPTRKPGSAPVVRNVAIARAVYFDAKILIMDEPTAALGPQETEMVAELIQELKKQGLGIFLIEHDIHNVKDQTLVDFHGTYAEYLAKQALDNS